MSDPSNPNAVVELRTDEDCRIVSWVSSAALYAFVLHAFRAWLDGSRNGTIIAPGADNGWRARKMTIFKCLARRQLSPPSMRARGLMPLSLVQRQTEEFEDKRRSHQGGSGGVNVTRALIKPERRDW